LIRKIFQAVLLFAAAAYAAVGIYTMTGALGLSGAADSLGWTYLVFGSIFMIIATLAAGATLLATKSRAWLFVAPVILGCGLPFGLFAAFFIDMEKGDVHRRQLEEEMRSGRYAFGDQPALLAVAQTIRANDQDGIRASAQNVSDLQTAGRDGMTLLSWTVRQTWQRPELVEAVKTLLSLGADPNYINEHRESFALANAVHGPAAGLRAMLEAGGNPNARNEYGWPIVFMHFKLGYYKDEERARLDMLLDRGADINSVVPATDSECAGCTLLLYTTQSGLHDSNEYANALHLLERGADPNRASADGMTFGKLLTERRKQFGNRAPPEFSQLWDWAQAHGMIH